jgi:hypothetical protein
MLGSSFAYSSLPASGTHGGILVVWHTMVWSADISQAPHCLTLRLAGPSSPTQWWLMILYGLLRDQDKEDFI